MIISVGGKEVLIDEEDSHYLKYTSSISTHGYVRCKVEGKTISLAKLIMNPPDGRVVDHISGNPLDNRRENLRVCTSQQNSWNRKLSKNSISGYKGVRVTKCKKNPYRVMIGVNGKTINLGSYCMLEQAAMVYNEAAKKYFGEFAKYN